jgi:hypothetical protein
MAYDLISTGSQPYGVPLSFSAQTSNGGTFTIAKGQLNKLRLRPQIINEHAESSREVQGVVRSTNIVGQVFKASHDNINGILLTLESAAGTSVDDFESYADSAALQAAWVEITTPALLETTIVKTGTKSMEIPLTTNGDEWVKTISSTDYTDFTFDFDYYQTSVLVGLVSFFIGDGTNTKSITLNINQANIWERFEVNENAMSEDGGGTTNMAAITKIGFRCDIKSTNNSGYVDNITAIPSPGSIEIKLWDFGATIPESTVDGLNDATQYERLGDEGFNGGAVSSSINLELKGGKKLYSIKTFVAGVALEIPTNELLTVGNYYAVTLHYVDTNVSVYGPNSSFSYQYYNNGYAFTTPDEVSVITAVGTYNDLMFGIFSTQDCYVNTIVKFFDATPGVNATEQVFVEDENRSITNIVVGDFRPLPAIEAEFNNRPTYLPKGGKFEVYYNDDFSDSVSVASVLMGYIYKPGDVNG